MNILKKNKSHDIIYILLYVLMVISFVLGFWVIKWQPVNDGNTESVNLSSVIGYLKFASPNKIQSLLSIALHNFGLALIAFLLSFFSSGYLGIIPLCSSFFIGGVTIYNSPQNLSTIFFVGLELVGMYLSVFGGVYLHKKRNKSLWPLEKIGVIAAALAGVLFVIYIAAAYIESNLLQSLWE